MLEDILTHPALTPTVMAMGAGTAVLFFLLGWAIKAAGARRREGEHRRDVLEAKRSIPQLESSIRKRENQISQLQAEVDELNGRCAELTTASEAKDQELRSSVRQARNLRSELEAVKGTKTESNNLIVDGFEDETPEDPEDSKLQAQLKRTQQLYDKLKETLIERDERIETLQAQLAAEAEPPLIDSQPDDSTAIAESLSEEAAVAKQQVSEHEATIAQLETRLQALESERDMLADMAKRRSENNLALKESNAEVEAQLPKLQQDVEERDALIGQREASIKRLQDELEHTQRLKARLEAEAAELSEALEATSAGLSETQDTLCTLQVTLAARDERVAILGQDLDNVRGELAAHDEAMDKLAATSAEIAEYRQAAAAQQQAITDRESEIEGLQQDLEALHAQLDAATSALEAARSAEHAAASEREEALAVQLADREKERSALLRETEDLRASLTQREKWLDKLKASLGEREAHSRQLETRAREAEQALQAAAAQGDEASGLQGALRERERELARAEAETTRAQAQLRELEQSLSLYKRVVEEQGVGITLDDAPAPVSDSPKVVPIRLARRKRRPRRSAPERPRVAKRATATTLAFRPRRQFRKRRSP